MSGTMPILIGFSGKANPPLMHLYSAIHPRGDVDRLYVRGDKGGRGLMSILYTVRYEEQSMIEYIRNKDSEIMTTIQHYNRETD